jgi:hypothetical protein
MKKGLTRDPDIYLGTKARERGNAQQSPLLSMQDAVRNDVAQCLEKNSGRELPWCCVGRWLTYYLSELDDTIESRPEPASYYLSVTEWCSANYGWRSDGLIWSPKLLSWPRTSLGRERAIWRQYFTPDLPDVGFQAMRLA